MVGALAAVTVERQVKGTPPLVSNERLPSIAEMRQALESKAISLADTALKGRDLDALITLLYRNLDLMATELTELPGCDVLLHRIETGDAAPVRKRSYRLSPADRAEVNRQVQEMADANIIEPSDSPWLSPLLLVSKKDGSKRLCVDYRSVNALTKLTSYPLPTLEEIFDTLSEERPVLWTSIDLRSGYWQTKLDPETADRTAFQTDTGNWQYCRTPFGLSGAPVFFQRIMSRVLQNLTPNVALIYLDDVLVLGKSAPNMLDRLQQVFDRFRSANLRMHPSKCHWAVARVHFLGHVLDERGISVDESKISIVRDFKRPNTPKRVKSFLGLANYYRRFVANFSQISAPLRALLKKETRFVWTSECEESFNKLKQALITAPVLRLPDFSKPFVLTTDASLDGISYILGQRDEAGREHVISYAGRSLRDGERRWGITELEGLAIVQGCRHFHVYLADKPFEIVTDHITMSFIKQMPLSGNNRLTRWALFLQQYVFSINYKRGETLNNADALSRLDREGEPPHPPERPDPYESDADALIFSCAAGGARTDIEFDYGQGQANEPAGVASVSARQLPSLEDVKSALDTCADFGDLMRYIRDGRLPNDDDQARRVVLEAQHYVVEDGALYNLFTPRTKHLDRVQAVMRRLCIPAPFREDVAIGLHDNNCHPGFDRTYSMARSRYWWPGMYAFIKQHVTTCFDCQQAKRPTHPGKTPICSLPAVAPLTRWHLDFHGPMVESNNKRYVLVLIDSSSMWVELIATEDCTAETVVRALFDNVISRFGLPRGISLLTDNGSGFIARLATKFCQVFGIKQFFTTPYHAQTNSRAEQFADTIHKSLRLLCNNQADWAEHLQAVAMAYRASDTTNLGLSPHEVIFGQRMTLALDWSLLAEDNTAGSPQAYAAMIRPKLQILQHIAMENAADSAARHSKTHNEAATVPSYAAGDKVLLFNPATKKNECAKLKRRYLGPYIITDCRPGYNYMLQELASGKSMKRPVHANRLRPLKELNNDYQRNTGNADVVMYAGETNHRSLTVSVKVGNIVHARTDVIVNPANRLLQHDAGAAAAIARAAGETLVSECQEGIRCLGPLAVAEPFLTTSGKLKPHVQAVVHVVGPNMHESPFQEDPILAQNKLQEAFYNCLRLVDQSSTFSSIAFPAISAGIYGMDSWTVAHAAAKAVKQFDVDTQQAPGSLRHIEFIMLSLTLADTVSAVCREVLPDAQGISHDVTSAADVTADNTPPGATNGPSQTTEPEAERSEEWYTIDRLLRHKRQRGKDWYLVKWVDYETPSWIERSNITDAALQHFYANRKRRKRRNYY